MIVSQLPVTAWHSVIGEGSIADAIVDRLVHYGHQITLSGPSWRTRITPPPIDTLVDGGQPGLTGPIRTAGCPRCRARVARPG